MKNETTEWIKRLLEISKKVTSEQEQNQTEWTNYLLGYIESAEFLLKNIIEIEPHIHPGDTSECFCKNENPK